MVRAALRTAHPGLVSDLEVNRTTGDAFLDRPLADIASDLARADQRAQERIAAKLGYRLVDHRLELFGVPLNKRNKS